MSMFIQRQCIRSLKNICASMLIMILVYGPTMSFAQTCDHVFKQNVAPQNDITINFNEFISWLTENGFLKLSHLQKFESHLKQGAIINPLAVSAATQSSAVDIHRQNLDGYLDAPLDSSAILEQVQALILRLSETKTEQAQTESRTRSTHQPMHFVRIPKGNFWRRMNDSMNMFREEVELTHDIEVMSTPVTQAMWVKYMGLNPSSFQDGPNAETIEINGQKIQLRPNNPVESISWWSAIVFANKVSQAHGLEPAYDLSGVDFQNARISEYDGQPRPPDSPQYQIIFNLAAQGKLSAVFDKAIHSRARINAPNENIYDAEGYRLITEAEFQYLSSNLGLITANSPGLFYFGEGKESFLKNTWNRENSGFQSRPVGDLTPLVVSGHGQFFDLIGNVDVFCHDRQETVDIPPKIKVIDPVVNATDYHPLDFAVFCGSNFGLDFESVGYPSPLRIRTRGTLYANHASAFTGLRLVRTLNPKR